MERPQMTRILMFLCALAITVAAPAYAQNIPATRTEKDSQSSPDTTPMLMLSRGTPTHPEKVILTWHKMVRQTPDFLLWAKKSPYLRKANAIDHDMIVNRESNRLQQDWNELDTSQLLNIQTVIHLNNYSTLQEQLIVGEFTSKTFFSFMMYDENIAVVPHDIARFNKIKITNAQMNDMLKKAGSGQIMAELLLKPLEADAKTPFVHGRMSYWLVLGQVMEIRFWSKSDGKDELLWMQRDPSYKPREDKSLLDLKSGAVLP
jgi:hypothetical protein